MKKGWPVFSFMLFMYILSRVFEFIHPALRYTKYVLPFIAAAELSVFKPSRKLELYFFHEYFKPYFYLYFLIIFYSFILIIFKPNSFYDLRFFQETYFILAPLVFVSIIYLFYVPSRKAYYVKYLFWGVVIAYFIQKGPTILNVLTHPSLFYSNSSNDSIDRPTESGASFSLGLLCIYFVFSGNKIYSILSLIFTIITFKRIALVGVCMSLTLYFLLRKTNFKIHHYRNLISILLTIINFLLVQIVINIGQGTYDELIFNYTGLSSNAFSEGRRYFYSIIIQLLDDSYLLGAGLGATWTTLGFNLHSDVLKNFIEFGPILFLVWSFLYYRFNTKMLEMFILTIYMNLLFLTDNVFIYFDELFIYYLLQGFLLSGNVGKGVDKEKKSCQ